LKPHIYRCHAGLAELAVPIVVNRKFLGAVITGQVRIHDFANGITTPLVKKNRYGKRLEKAFQKIPVLSMRQMKAVGDMLDGMINYIFRMEYDLLVSKELSRPRSYSQEIAERALHFIKENFSQSVTLQNVAEHVKLSPFYLAHLLKKETGYSFMEYLVKLRMGEASSILKSTNRSIKEIAYQVGYDNPTYFSKVFRHHFKKSPQVFRRHYQK
jgi:YesN/AraC family two-component response regulator